MSRDELLQTRGDVPGQTCSSTPRVFSVLAWDIWFTVQVLTVCVSRGTWPLGPCGSAEECMSTFHVIPWLREAAGRWPGFPSDGCIPSGVCTHQFHGLACGQPAAHRVTWEGGRGPQ